MKKVFLIFFLAFGFTIISVTQQAFTDEKLQASSVKTLQLDSKLMMRQVPYNVILPSAYETEKTARFPVLYLLHGYGGNYKSWGQYSKLVEYATQYRIIIVTPEGANGFYTDSVTKPSEKYESYIVQELIAEVDKEFRTTASRQGRAVAGNSMGGYGALKFGIKHPDKFILAASMSGAVRIASWRKPEDITAPDIIKNSLLSIFGDKDTKVLEANDLYKIFNEIPEVKIVTLPFFYVDCGTEDDFGLFPQNQDFAQLLLKRKIPHEFRQLPGKHNGEFWKNQVHEILRLSERVFMSQTKQEASK